MEFIFTLRKTGLPKTRAAELLWPVLRQQVPYNVTEFVYLFILIVLNNLRGRHTDTQVHIIHTYIHTGCRQKQSLEISCALHGHRPGWCRPATKTTV